MYLIPNEAVYQIRLKRIAERLVADKFRTLQLCFSGFDLVAFMLKEPNKPLSIR